MDVNHRSCLAAIALLSALAACDGPNDPPDPVPAILASSIEAADGPLFRTLRVSLEGVAAIEVEFWSEDSDVLQVRSPEGTEHEILLPRLKAATTYEYRTRVIAMNGAGGEPVLGSFATGPLPANLADFSFEVSGTPSVPLVLLVISRAEGFSGYVIVDGSGNVVWYLDVDGASGITRRSNGNFVAVTRRGLVEITPTRQVIAETLSDSVGRRFHHDVIPTPRNTLLAIATDTQTVLGTRFTGESIWEWTPETGEIRKRWSSFDFLDPYSDRGSLFSEGNWMHANSLWLSDRGNVILSSNYLSQIMSISPDFTSLEWRLGGPNATIQLPEAERFTGQHTAAEIRPGRILMFDNRRVQGGYSRAVELELVGNEAYRVWEWRPERVNFSYAVSSARRLPVGTTLVTFGLGAGIADSTGPTEVYEVTESGEVRWHLEVEGLEVMYRAEPIFDIAGEVVISVDR